MKKLPWLLILIFIPVMAAWPMPAPVFAGLFNRQSPVPIPGVYPVKLRNLTFFDLISKDLDMLMFCRAELTDSKPEDLEVDLGELDLTGMKYGCFKFGNLDRKTWFVMGKDDDGYWTEFYIDQDMDQRIETKERVKGFQTGRDLVRSIRRLQALSLVPVSVKVLFKGARREFEKNLYFFIRTNSYKKDNQEDTLVVATTASFFEGEWKVAEGQKTKTVKFRIVDANGNGCFNDFETDLLIMDLNQDGYFRKKEVNQIKEYPVTSDKKQYRIVVPSFPAKIAVVDVTAEIEPETLEPAPAGNNLQPETNPGENPAPTPTTVPLRTAP